MGSHMGLIGWLVVVVAIVLLRDSHGWTVPPNTSYYSTWATTKTFLISWRQTLISKVDYESCTNDVAIRFGSPGLLTPETVGSYYIICTVDDHCARGQKFSFTVGLPTQSPTFSASISLSVGALFARLSTTVTYFLA